TRVTPTSLAPSSWPADPSVNRGKRKRRPDQKLRSRTRRSPMSFVLIHGAGFGANCWDELIPHLNAEALAVDLPGRGTRADVSLRAITLADCAGAVREDVEAKDLRDVVLVGHSFAGVTVPRVLDLLPDRIRHVVLVSAVVPPDGPRVQCYVEELQQRSIALLRPDVIDLDTGHMAMISAPAELAAVLNAIHG